MMNGKVEPKNAFTLCAAFTFSLHLISLVCAMFIRTGNVQNVMKSWLETTIFVY